MTDLRIGIIGCDTSHTPAFARLLSDPNDPYYVAGAKVVAAYPSFSEDLPFSVSRVEGFTQQLRECCDVELVDSVEALVERVDAVMLESVDGRRHLAEVTPVLAANKPVFIDKPMAACYADAAAIVARVKESGGRAFSASSLRYDVNILALKEDPSLGAVVGCDAYSPATLDPTNPGLFWYGVHGVETLYAFMGPGCQSLTCHSTPGAEVVVGRWADGRLGTVRGTREGSHDYGARVFGSERVAQTSYSHEVPLYSGLVKRIMAFLQGGAGAGVSGGDAGDDGLYAGRPPERARGPRCRARRGALGCRSRRVNPPVQTTEPVAQDKAHPPRRRVETWFWARFLVLTLNPLCSVFPSPAWGEGGADTGSRG